MKKHTLNEQSVLTTIAVFALVTVAASLLTLPGRQLLSNMTSGMPGTEGSESGEEGESSGTRSSASSRPNGGGSGTAESSRRSSSAAGTEDKCTLSLSQCGSMQSTCVAPPVFVYNVSCSDSRCFLPGNICMPISRTSSASSKPAQTEPEPENGRSGQSGQGSWPATSGGTSGTSGQTGGSTTLGCFTVEGKWTTDRTLCDPDQSKYLSSGKARPTVPTTTTPGATTNPQTGTQTPSTTVSTPTASHIEVENDRHDAQLQSQLEEKFHMQQQVDAATNSLLATATSALQRLQGISTQSFPSDAATAVENTQNWLSSLIATLSTNQLGLSELQTNAADLKDRLDATSKVIAASVVPVQRHPETLTGKMDRLFATIPSIFSYLQDQGVATSDDAMTAFQTATISYQSIRPLCLENADNCQQLVPVLDNLTSMRTAISASLEAAGKTDLQGRIDEMLR